MRIGHESARWLFVSAGAVALLGGCAARRHQTIEYLPVDDHHYRSRDQPAQRTAQGSEELSAAGYAQIGTLTVIRVTSICYETCKKIAHEQDTTATLLDEAGRLGGDLVVLVHDGDEFTREVSEEGACLESYIEDSEVEIYLPPAAASGTPGRFETAVRSREVCTRFEQRHGHETFEQSTGSVWRRSGDPR